MYIMTQNNKNLLNTFYVIGYEVKEGDFKNEDDEDMQGEIIAVCTTGSIILGMYKDLDRAKEILMDLFINIDKTRFEMPLY